MEYLKPELLRPIESPEATLEHVTEMVGETLVGGFETSDTLTSPEVADFLGEVLPPSHLECCPAIEYEPSHFVFICKPQFT